MPKAASSFRYTSNVVPFFFSLAFAIKYKINASWNFDFWLCLMPLESDHSTYFLWSSFLAVTASCIIAQASLNPGNALPRLWLEIFTGATDLLSVASTQQCRCQTKNGGGEEKKRKGSEERKEALVFLSKCKNHTYVSVAKPRLVVKITNDYTHT